MNEILKRCMGLSAIALSLGAVSSCGDATTEERIRKEKLSGGCLINTDCAEPLVCAFRRCHEECTTSRDCPSGQRCVAADRPFSVCQLPDERECTYNSECPEGQLCAGDATCRDQCAGDRDCLAEQTCVSGTCADTAELIDGGLPSSPEIEAGTGSPCTYNSDCPEPLACVDSQCRLECVEDRDCLPTFRCNPGHRCQPGPAVPDAG